MTRVVAYLIAFVLVIGVARSVIRILLKGLAELFNFNPASSPARPQTGPESLPTSDALKRDPVCGTFIGASTSLQKTAGGKTYYFCSVECRDKFRG